MLQYKKKWEQDQGGLWKWENEYEGFSQFWLRTPWNEEDKDDDIK